MSCPTTEQTLTAYLDGELDLTSGVARPTGRTFHLAEHAGLRPVALIFGSYT